VIDGSSVVLCDGNELIDVLRHGQGVLNILPMSGVRDEVDRQIITLRPDMEGDDIKTVAI
jgi:hypothetical protein